MLLLLLKSLHIIGFVTWFAGLFYLVRLFVYHREAASRSPEERRLLEEQYALMEKRLYRIITNPAMMITWIGGAGMLIVNPAYLSQGWLHVKLLLVVLLSGYHHTMPGIMRKLAAGQPVMDAFRFRLFNELPTLFLVSIVLLAVLRNNVNYAYLAGGLIAFALLIYWSAVAYRRRRTAGK